MLSVYTFGSGECDQLGIYHKYNFRTRRRCSRTKNSSNA